MTIFIDATAVESFRHWDDAMHAAARYRAFYPRAKVFVLPA